MSLFRWWKHLKRESVYQEICRGEIQTKISIPEGTIVVVYRGTDGKYWVRPEIEFEDGRYQEINPYPESALPSAEAKYKLLLNAILEHQKKMAYHGSDTDFMLWDTLLNPILNRKEP